MSITKRERWILQKKDWFNRLYDKIITIVSLLTSTRIYLALNGMFLYAFTSHLYHGKSNPFLLEASFMITLAVYTLNLVTDTSEDSINRGVLDIKGKEFLVFSILATVLATSTCAFVSVEKVIIILIPFFSGILYSIRLFPRLRRGKEVLGLKSIIVATSWALTGALLPLHHNSIRVTLIIFINIFIQIFNGTVLGDILDMDGDLKNNIKTIPLYLGLKKTRLLMLILNTLFIPVILYSFFNNLLVKYIPVFIFAILYYYIMILYFCSNKKKRLNYEFFIDGMWLPQLFIVFFINKLI